VSDAPAAPASLAAALTQLQGALPRVGKGAEGQAGNKRYKYADLAAITAELMPELARRGLSFTACPTLTSVGGELKGELKFVLDYQLLHAATGEYRGGMYPLGTGTPQQLGSAISYARRYCLMAVTGLAPDDGSDDDAQAAEQSWRERRNAPPEVRADGSATEAEIMRMQRGREPGVERLNATPADDPFYDARSAAAGPPEERPGSVTREQHRLIARVLRAVGIATDEEARAECARRIGRPVASRSQLSYVDARAVIEWKEPAGASQPLPG
jgi:hypothetical protein